MTKVKLTIDVPETLRRRAKAAVALRGDTLSDVVRRALEAYIEETEDIRLVDKIERRIAEGKESIHSHEEVWAERHETTKAKRNRP